MCVYVVCVCLCVCVLVCIFALFMSLFIETAAQRNCEDLRLGGTTENGIYTIDPGGAGGLQPFQVSKLTCIQFTNFLYICIFDTPCSSYNKSLGSKCLLML